jgi:large subunit ribosomal protein L17
LITKSKDDSTHSRRTVFSYLQNKEATAALFRDVAPKDRQNVRGYTAHHQDGQPLGDAAEMAMIELVDFNTTYTKEKAGTAAKKTPPYTPSKGRSAPADRGCSRNRLPNCATMKNRGGAM